MFDAYFIGVLIFSIGVFLAQFYELNESSLTLFEMTTLLLVVVFLVWFMSLFLSQNRMQFQHFNIGTSSNHFFAIFSAVFLVFVNFVFIYLVYTRIIKGHFAGAFVLLDIRKTIASGEAGYFYPGLVKQVRDIYGPAFLVWISLFYTGVYRRQVYWVVLITTLLSMMIGGQRTPILVLLLSVLLVGFIKNKLQQKKIKISKFLFIVPTALLFLLLLNILLGRSDQEQNLFVSIFTLVVSLLGRVFTTVPIENIHALKFIENINIEYFSLWMSDLSILLPGTQTGFSNELHSFLGGSKQGNAVLGYSLDIVVNSGYPGLVVVPLVTYVALNTIQASIIRNKNAFSISIFLIALLYLPFCYSFYHFLLNGGLLLIAYVIYDILVVRKTNVLEN
ncbi:hypothetical protein TK45_02910 [Bowmanella sp. JS7-9]|nr:hypothetical protein TK45_02910 [Bowmanella sp. JS7-9]